MRAQLLDHFAHLHVTWSVNPDLIHYGSADSQAAPMVNARSGSPVGYAIPGAPVDAGSIR
ncbi:hypothetical protein AYM40_19980 [Paraburkholderia phytofirmans OLGA172]|uniref:Uncharacterized protein n=1 Tax=Paraburkholderia phytofirmans OLGA172 TaxID=1417228 RepID=A0A161HPD1_9BURK|nr:hypothetical protein [Paraburkholderia phytofirmans]ANB74397.1 hypothetical protein AYM40_19980 [Paraburkholderia phytofirmans OLGA172]